MYQYCFLRIAPGPPSNVAINPQTSRSLLLSWDPPTQPNGVITGYNYSCYQVESNEIITGSVTSTSTVIHQLLPNTNYYCSVSASTLAGVGPSSPTVNATTYEDSKEYKLYALLFLLFSFSTQFLVLLLISVQLLSTNPYSHFTGSHH